MLVTLDNHLAGAVDRARAQLVEQWPGMELTLHAASDWDADPEALARCIEDIGRGDIVVATMLFLEPQINAVLPALKARRENCDALVCAMSAGEVVKLTRLGGFVMDGSSSGPTMKLLKKIRGAVAAGKGETKGAAQSTAGARQMAMLRRIPKILRFIPGKAQDVTGLFHGALQYWLAGSDENVAQHDPLPDHPLCIVRTRGHI